MYGNTDPFINGIFPQKKTFPMCGKMKKSFDVVPWANHLCLWFCWLASLDLVGPRGAAATAAASRAAGALRPPWPPWQGWSPRSAKWCTGKESLEHKLEKGGHEMTLVNLVLDFEHSFGMFGHV